ncbi:MAG TPA: class I poly(R)-hydroxyalkanoic acid synthase [Alphaproteobacteria bacterium]|nr:class I poly(R)-hydroxyalkanoic acid synthase [Alphaproteobacteria bacterium]
MQNNEKQQNIANSWWTFLENFQEQNQRMAKTYFDGMQHHTPLPPTLMGDAFIKAGQALLENPSYLLKAQEELMEEVNELWQKMLSAEKGPTTELTRDKRFRHEAWESVPYFLFIKEYYLITSRWLQKLVSEVEGLDDKTTHKIQFFTKQLADAISPTNFPFTNPEVIEELVKTQGTSLQKGFETLLEDMESGKWMKMTDPKAFELGKTLASTPGDVVFRNDLFELIHYRPLTEKQYAIPLLIIPAWINKYYIFDLSQNNSYIKWMLNKGYNVFIISWVNPKSNNASKTFEDYLVEGIYRASDVICSLTQSSSLHTMGYCLGGNLLAALAAYIAKSKASFSLQSMTLLATIMDFTKIGDLKIFMNEDTLQCMEETMAQKGFLESDTLKSIFSLLKPNELVWSFFVKNYLLGQIPPAFDFLYWNADSTRVPANLHSFIIRRCFQENRFMQPGGINIQGISLDLQEITTPAFLLSTFEDHISPWKSCYPAAHLFKGPLKFVLAGSGHVAGVINPPSQNKYYAYTNSHFPINPDDWLENATRTEGSWWTLWDQWVSPLSGEKTVPLTNYPSLEPAPGSYVREIYE